LSVDKLFHYRCVNCELLRNSQSELAAIWGLGSGRKRKGQREGKFTERLEFGQDAAISVEEEAIFVQSCTCKSRARDLDLEHTHGCALTWRPWCASLVAIEPFES